MLDRAEYQRRRRAQAGPCLHCRANKGTQPRSLCRSCYDERWIREKYAKKATPPRPFGPYATADGKVSPKGRAIILEWMAKYPRPCMVLRWKFPALYHYAREVRRYTDDEISEVVLCAAVDAVLTWEPAPEKTFGGYVKYVAFNAMRAELGRGDAEGTAPRTLSGHAAIDYKAVPSAASEAEAAETSRLITERIESCLAGQQKSHRAMIELRYGLKDCIPRTCEEVGELSGGLGRSAVDYAQRVVFKQIAPSLEPTYWELCS